jgi:hypothetical protein
VGRARENAWDYRRSPILLFPKPLTILLYDRWNMNSSEPSERRRLVAAPEPSHPGLRSTMLNVDCADDEDVEWQWTDTPAGRFVSGYRIVPRRAEPPR